MAKAPALGDGRLARAIRENWEKFVEERAHRDVDGQIVWSERLIAEMGEAAAATLLFLAQRGDREASRIVFEKFVGAPEAPYRVQVANMSREQAIAKLKVVLLQLDLAPQSIEGLLKRATAAAQGKLKAGPAKEEAA